MLAAPASLVCEVERAGSTRDHHRYADTCRPSLRNGLRLIRDLLGVPGFLATVALPTSGSAWFQRRGIRTTRFRRPPRSRSPRDIKASIASRANVRDDRETPLLRRETRGLKPLICPTAQARMTAAQ